MEKAPVRYVKKNPYSCVQRHGIELKGGRKMEIIHDEADYKKVHFVITNNRDRVIENFEINAEDLISCLKGISFGYNRCKEEMEPDLTGTEEQDAD